MPHKLIVAPELTKAQLKAKKRKVANSLMTPVTVSPEEKETAQESPEQAPISDLPPLPELKETHGTLTTIVKGKRVTKRVPYLEHSIRTTYTDYQRARLAAELHEINRRHGEASVFKSSGAIWLMHQGFLVKTAKGWEASEKTRALMRDAVKHLQRKAAIPGAIKPRTSGKYPLDMTIRALQEDNPSREGTKANIFYELIKKGGTVESYLEAGGNQNYLVWFVDRGFAEVL
jgi:hypothetical protein